MASNTAQHAHTFIVEDMPSLSYLLTEAALVGEGQELRATTRARVASIIPEFGTYWYHGCAHWVKSQGRYCRKAVGLPRALFADEDSEQYHAGTCHGNRSMPFWRFAVMMKDDTASLEALVWGAGSYLMGDHELPLHADQFWKMPLQKQQAVLEKILTRGVSFVLDVVYRKAVNEHFGQWTVEFVRSPAGDQPLPRSPYHTHIDSDGPIPQSKPRALHSTTSILYCDYQQAVWDNSISPYAISFICPPSEYRVRVLSNDNASQPHSPRTVPKLVMDASLKSTPSGPRIIDIQEGLTHLSIGGMTDDGCGEKCTLTPSRPQEKSDGWEAGILSLKLAIQAVDDLKYKMVHQLRAMEDQYEEAMNS